MLEQLPLLNVANTSGCGSCTSKARPRNISALALQEEMRTLVQRAADQQAEHVTLSAAPADSGPAEFTLALDEPVPLVHELHHEPVNGSHVWVGVQEAALAVADDAQHRLIVRLVAGESPRSVANDVGWSVASNVVSLLATSGLVRGLTGYRDRTPSGVTVFARLHLTQACQLECAHCYADSSPHVDRANELPTARWRRFIDDFAALGGKQVLFTGGEALMHSGCLELMAAAKEHRMKVTLFSNGLLIPKLAEQIHPLVDLVQISIDGPDAESHDEIRGRNSFKHAIAAVDRLAELGTPTRIGMTIVPATWPNWVQKFPQLRDRFAGAPNVVFKFTYGIMPHGRGSQIDPAGPASREEVSELLAAVNGAAPQITRHMATCGYADQMVIGPDGSVYPCHLLDGKVCHIDDMPVRNIVDLVAGLATQIDVDHVEGCKTCEIRYLCGGTCRVRDSKNTGSRLITTCTPEDKNRIYAKMAGDFAQHAR
ncbi:radical SAM/SPASM domain-containing protein [Streptomyces litmocidini]|uniref:radical SAM/SPASM domain-containing protein n=1 Tax=Streptomyces litmocidini TaxID=67318 RepID=UPI00167F15EA|nr:radical SAM protein [Streptomyces litmocidini]